MAMMQDKNKRSERIQAKKALLRKITIMKLAQFGQAVALIAIAAKYTGLLDKLTQLLG